MVVNDKDNIDVHLNLLPLKWNYTVAKASKKTLVPERNASVDSLPRETSEIFQFIKYEDKRDVFSFKGT